MLEYPRNRLAAIPSAAGNMKERSDVKMETQNTAGTDLVGLWRFVRKRLWLVPAVMLLCAIVSLAAGRLLLTERYSASTRIYVLTRASESEVVYSDLQISSQLLNDIKVLVTGQNVTKTVVEKLALACMPEELARRISVSAPDNTRVLQISVEDPNPVLAAQIANAVREEASLQIRSIMSVDSVKLVYAAEPPGEPAWPNLPKLAAAAAVGAGALCLCILAVIYLLDDGLRSEEDVERCLGIPALAAVPVATDLVRRQKKWAAGKWGV